MKNLFSREVIQKVLKLAGLYNLVFGFICLVFPQLFFKQVGIEEINYPIIWQALGMIVGVYGIGYYIASFSPEEHWAIVLVGFLGKIFGITGFVIFFFSGKIPLNFLPLILFNDILWIIPFYYSLKLAFEYYNLDDSSLFSFSELLKYVRISNGKKLIEFSNEKPVLLIFIRHFGCTFCRETVSEVSKIENEITAKGFTPVFVHMSDPGFGDQFFGKYFSHEVLHISDPNRSLYRALNLKRGTLLQLFGPKTWYRGFIAGIIKGHGIGELEGDGLQLGGFFVLDKGQIVFSHPATCASEQFNLNLIPNF